MKLFRWTSETMQITCYYWSDEIEFSSVTRSMDITSTWIHAWEAPELTYVVVYTPLHETSVEVTDPVIKAFYQEIK